MQPLAANVCSTVLHCTQPYTFDSATLLFHLTASLRVGWLWSGGGVGDVLLYMVYDVRSPAPRLFTVVITLL
jgi:hypothetical protein